MIIASFHSWFLFYHSNLTFQYLKKYVLKLAPELYDSLMSHMAQCAVAYRHAAVLEARRDILLSLFTGIDNADVGILNRHRVLGLFENFWENVPWSIKRHLRNPRKCKKIITIIVLLVFQSIIP